MPHADYYGRMTRAGENSRLRAVRSGAVHWQAGINFQYIVREMLEDPGLSAWVARITPLLVNVI